MFLESFINFIEQSNDLKHLEISGMGYGKEQLRKLTIEGLVASKSLIAIHLSDCGLSFDQELRDEILDIFGLGSESIESLESMIGHKTNKEVVNPDIIKRVVNSYTKHVDSKDILTNGKVNSVNYKSHMLRSKQGKALEMSKGINSIKVANGLGRCKNNMVDQFLFTRKINYPELVYNQFLHID